MKTKTFNTSCYFIACLYYLSILFWNAKLVLMLFQVISLHEILEKPEVKLECQTRQLGIPPYKFMTNRMSLLVTEIMTLLSRSNNVSGDYSGGNVRATYCNYSSSFSGKNRMNQDTSDIMKHDCICAFKMSLSDMLVSWEQHADRFSLELQKQQWVFCIRMTSFWE